MEERSVAKNAVWIIGCKLAKAVLTFVLTMFTSRYLGVANYGLISYAAGVVTFVTPLMKLGINEILVHELIKEPKKEGEILGTTIFMNLISGALCILGIVAFTCVANRGEQDTLIVCALYSLLLLFQALEMIQYWFHAKLLAKFSAIAMLISYVCISVIQILFIVFKLNVYWFAFSYSLDFLLIAIILLIIYHKKGNQKLSISLPRAKQLFSVGKYYIIANLMVSAFSQTDRIMLKLMIGNEETGIYSAAMTCASMFSFVFVAIIDSMRPAIFSAKETDVKLFEKRIVELYSIITYFSLAVSFCMTVLASPIIDIMYGKAYFASKTVLQIGIWFTTFSYYGTIRNIWLLSENSQKLIVPINLFGVLTNLGLNLLLIPRWGAIGAAIASLITQIVANVVIGYVIKPLRHNNLLMLKGFDPRNIKSFLFKIIRSKNG